MGFWPVRHPKKPRKFQGFSALLNRLYLTTIPSNSQSLRELVRIVGPALTRFAKSRYSPSKSVDLNTYFVGRVMAAGKPSSIPLLDVNRGNALVHEQVMQAIEAVVRSGKFLHGPDVGELEWEAMRCCWL
jgi:hypothetical protein